MVAARVLAPHTKLATTRVRAHIFLCMLAYYVEWHMREAWRELMFADEDLERKNIAIRSPPPSDPKPRSRKSPLANSKAVHPPTAFVRSSTNSAPSCAILVSHESLTAAVPRSR
jgi:hypothetical protein